jgi:murein DD-endopeptidase MepM/ murein hydrolase activator NlpD
VKGQYIGLTGKRNLVDPHLHFEIRIENAGGGYSIKNPEFYLGNIPEAE